MTIPLLPDSEVLSDRRLPSNGIILESESYVTADGQSVSLSWNRAPIWGLRPQVCYCQTVAGLLIWGAPGSESRGTLSNSRLPISSPPTTRRATTVEVFDPAFTRVWTILVSIGLLVIPLHGPSIIHRFQGYIYCCMRICCCGNLFTNSLPRNGSGIFAYLAVIA
jgi:hypothetical protein